MEAKINSYTVLVGKPEGKDHLVDSGANGRIILKFILERNIH